MMTTVLVDVIVKICTAVFAIPIVNKAIQDTFAGRKSQFREEYKFAKEFLEEREKNPNLHPFLVEKGYSAITGSIYFSPEEIAYILSLENPGRCLRDYILSKKYLKIIDANGEPHLAFAKQYSSSLYRSLVKGFYLLLYLILIIIAIFPIFTPSPFTAIIFITLPLFGYPALNALNSCNKVRRGEQLVKNQRFHQVSIVNELRSFAIDSKALLVIFFLLQDWFNFNDTDNNSINQNTKSISIGKIAKDTSISEEDVVNILENLYVMGYCKKKEGIYKIADFTKLWERWELGYSEQLRRKFFIGAFSPIKDNDFLDVSDGIWKAKEQGADSTYLVGGELAAAQKISYLSPIGMTLHLQSGLNSNTLAVNLKLKPNPEGTIIFLRDPRKWDAITAEEKFTGLANPLFIHAELVQSSDSRLRETAQMIYKEFIKK